MNEQEIKQAIQKTVIALAKDPKNPDHYHELAKYYAMSEEYEKDVLLLVTQGESNKSIAEKLVLSEVTVKSHLCNIFKKLNVTNRTQAVLIAMQMNLVEK